MRHLEESSGCPFCGQKIKIYKKTCSNPPGIVYWEKKMKETGDTETDGRAESTFGRNFR